MLPNAKGDPYEYCWGCGFCAEPDWQEKAHIVAHEDGGSTDPSNFFLLCHICHKEQPSRLPKGLQIEWLKRRPHFETVTRAKYGPEIQELLQSLKKKNVPWSEFLEWAEEHRKREPLSSGGHSLRADMSVFLCMARARWCDQTPEKGEA